MNWVVFAYSLPGKSGSGPRVNLWRRLRRLGAVSPAGGAQVLPAREDCIEAFQWLAREIRQAKGEAMVMRVEQFEGLSDQQLIDLFHTARAEDYTALDVQTVKLEKLMGKRVKPEDAPHLRDELEKMRRRYTEIRRVDYFNSPLGERLGSRLTELEQRLSPSTTVTTPKLARAAIGDYRGRRWVTRPRPHVDRLACAWLIRRFIDPAATIRYAERPKATEIAFDMDEGEFGHQGNLCTFEVLRLTFALDESALQTMAEIVHEIDLRDGRYLRPETAGVDAILNGWQLTDWSDAEREAHGVALFQGLYQTLSSSSAAALRPEGG